MNRSTQSLFSVVGVLGAMFGLMTFAVVDDLGPGQTHTAAPTVLVATTDATFVMPTVTVVPDPAVLASIEAIEAAERAVLAAALVPVPLREAQAQFEKASAATHRASRVSLRLPYYAFGPDPLGGSR